MDSIIVEKYAPMKYFWELMRKKQLHWFQKPYFKNHSYLFAIFIIIFVVSSIHRTFFISIHSGPCVIISDPVQNLFESAIKVAKYMETYKSVNILTSESEGELPLHEVFGLETCSSNDRKLRETLKSDVCVTLPKRGSCKADAEISEQRYFEVSRDLLSSRKCKGYVDLVVNMKSKTLKHLEKFGVTDSQFISTTDVSRAISVLRSLTETEIPKVIIHDENPFDDVGYSTKGIFWRRGGTRSLHRINNPPCARYGFVGADISSRLVLHIHGVKNVICHTNSSCEYMKNHGYKIFPLQDW